MMWSNQNQEFISSVRHLEIEDKGTDLSSKRYLRPYVRAAVRLRSGCLSLGPSGLLASRDLRSEARLEWLEPGYRAC